MKPSGQARLLAVAIDQQLSPDTTVWYFVHVTPGCCDGAGVPADVEAEGVAEGKEDVTDPGLPATQTLCPI